MIWYGLLTTWTRCVGAWPFPTPTQVGIGSWRSRSFRSCFPGVFADSNICGTRAILPTSYTLSADLLDIGSHPLDSEGYGDVYLGILCGSKVHVKHVRMVHKRSPRCVIGAVTFPTYCRQRKPQIFCKEAVVWKRLKHPNIVSLPGVTITPLQPISSSTPGGNLPEYIKSHPGADRPEFVGVPT
ncbi:hypothetical protein BDM02DRAFT_1709334 [Thelephora ganbajun]|uniref:Uncharacterized protein n=1 Tax=Thelephora ganbajun TaxID=370292 RepID=A0ACB6Z1Y4_THEGA|nr:hypothetical protein BDM02DRAFT_1709334 [Thelephora ganbajun]